ncbi:MAG: hypothetical protein AB7H86_17525 [Blastocatellales bacterium]
MNAKYFRAILAVAALVMMTAFTVNAQGIAVKGDIPFDFIVGDTLMKAGVYTVDKHNMPGSVMMVNGYETGDRAARLINRVERAKPAKETVLIFNRYRDNGGEVSTYLSQVWIDGMPTGFEFLKGRTEREAAARAATRDIITLVVTRIDR